MFRASDGIHFMHDLGNGKHIHVVLPSDTGPGQPVAALIPLDPQGFDRIETVLRLLSSLHGRAVPPDTRLTPQQLLRARRMLQAHDAVENGATQKEIAEVILRTGKLSRDEWQVASARHAVMSLLRGARSMVAGGYRKLLRHRRRP